MGDMGDSFRAWTKSKQEKRWSNLEWSTNYLKEVGIPFTSHNGGVHLIIDGPDGWIDFWPSTGKWIFRSGEKGRGIQNLFKMIGKVNANG
jgi:hypothetical protein